MLRRQFGALGTVSEHVLPAGLRYILRVTGLSAASLTSLLRAAAVGVSYFVLAKGSLTLASLHPSATPVWPPSGLALAGFLLWGNSLWPAIAAAAFLANVTTFGSLFTSCLIAGGNTLEAMITASLLKRFTASTNAFEAPFHIVAFACLALAPGTMISATVGVGSLVLAGFAESAKFPGVWLTWWLGDVGGQLLVTPFIVLWAKSGLKEIDRPELGRLALLLGVTIIVGLIAFSPLIQQTGVRGSLAFVAVAPLLWAALRHNQRDTATVALALSGFAIWGTLSDGGPFARPDLNDSFLLTVAFVISTAVPSLVLSADVAARRLNEERHRALVEHANDIVATLDLDMRFTSVNPAVERVLGYAPADMIGRLLSRHVPPEQLSAHAEMLDRKLHGTPSTQYEVEVLTKAGSRRTLEVNSKLIADATDKPVAIHVIARDITDRKESAARQTLLVQELQHRTKNLLAVVQSIMRLTLRASTDLTSAEETITARLHALAHAQDFVAAGPSGGVPVEQLLEAELSAFKDRIDMAGEQLVVGGAFAQNFALLTHELATNALKHGAFGRAGGRVTIRWSVDRARVEPLLQFSWIERGGPPVRLPERSGMGRMLMSSIGTCDVAFHEGGFEYHLEVPWSQVAS
jgi:PAS domain S-box-containing protein